MKNKRLILIGAIAWMLAACSPTVATSTPMTPAASPTSATPTPATRDQSRASSARVDREVTYCLAAGVALKMDIYYPQKSEGKPAPVAVYVHGGGWTSGDKGGGAGTVETPELVARGYLVAAVNYRLAPTFKFPAEIEDVKCAIRFLRANAAKYDLDPNRIGAWGGSAGGHLVALLGTSDANAGLEGGGGYAEQSSRVQAVVDMFGPADFTGDYGSINTRLMQNVFGASASNAAEIAKRYSPTTYISKDDPPFLILHGEQDQVVPLSQSQILLEKLKAGGVDATLVVVKNAGHSFSRAGGAINPSRTEITKIVVDFFDKQLKGR
ncbi:MAG: alpha/beta hydrolase [Chloroflexi bacterium]|nr:alpha/beta hydrolase [Chloroflexota bacterium]